RNGRGSHERSLFAPRAGRWYDRGPFSAGRRSRPARLGHGGPHAIRTFLPPQPRRRIPRRRRPRARRLSPVHLPRLREPAVVGAGGLLSDVLPADLLEPSVYLAQLHPQPVLRLPLAEPGLRRAGVDRHRHAAPVVPPLPHEPP